MLKLAVSENQLISLWHWKMQAFAGHQIAPDRVTNAPKFTVRAGD